MNLTRKRIDPSLERILQRFSLSENEMPKDILTWLNFLLRINNCFYDFEQELYLLERSVEISSHEFREVIESFEWAEETAHIGHWFHFMNEDKSVWSKEMYKIYGVDLNQPAPSLQNFLNFVYEEDKDNLLRHINKAALTGESFEMRCRFYHQENKNVIWTYGKINVIPVKQDESKQLKFPFNLSGIVMEVTERKNAEDSLAQMNQKLIELSRRAGMSDVATAVLHNIGNILNSANVSIFASKEILENSPVKTLADVSGMISDNIPENPTYLAMDEKGKLIPKYLVLLSDSLQTENKKLLAEIDSLQEYLNHIKSIVAIQNNLSGIKDFKEKVNIPELCDQAIMMVGNLNESSEICVEKNYYFNESVLLDKTKTLQILVNLIQNAKEALKASEIQCSKKISILIGSPDEKGNIEITVSDNGVGVLPENLTKIFIFSFTTKPNGHGFGLHSSALAAKEMGGSLLVKSQGLNKGATFILTLPVRQL